MCNSNLKYSLNLLVFALSFSIFSYSQSNKLIISEFMAINDTTLADEDGDFSDWIEIYNPGTETVNLDGWYLTDNPSNLIKWSFPSVSLHADDYLVVFASDKNKTLVSGNLHTNFKLSGSGEFLALVEPDGSTISFSFGDEYPPQQEDVSYGLIDDQYIYFQKSTPGAKNIIDGYISETIFSHKRGFYSAPFNVNLSNINSNCDIYYTLDGSSPTPVNGTKYTSPVLIDKTTVLSAVSIDNSTNDTSIIVTQSYLFVDNILAQPNNPSGYTSDWGEGYPGDYEMDPEICTTENKAKLTEALKSLPTLSLVIDIDHLFSASDDPFIGGIYVNPTKHTYEWERPVSMEYFDTTQNQNFQINCGLRIHGGNGRKPGNSPKHSFRVSFRSEYGPSKLKANLFDEKSASNEFNSLVLRAGYNYSWLKNSPEQCEGTDYVRDPFTKKTQLDMDRTSAHTKFVHLYINGLYWGVYNISEKITDDFAEEYLGGNEEDYDVIKDQGEIGDGNSDAWDTLIKAALNGFESIADYQKIQGKNEDGSVNSSYLNLLDVRNLADYMLINFYIGNEDWDNNNWIAVRNRVTNEDGFKFFCWDSETSMNDLNENIVGINNPNQPSGLFRLLLKNEEFKLYFADRIHKHFFNGGALTPTEAKARFMKIANTIDKAMLAESARWGDYRRDVDPGSNTYELYTQEGHWLERIESMQSTYLPQRSDIVLNQLIDAGLYSEIDAPVFSPFGGDYGSSVSLSMSAGSNTIYYTTDNSDPREIGGAVAVGRAVEYSNPIDINESVIIKARAKNGDVWSALTKAKFNVYYIDTTIITESICEGEEYHGFTTTGTHFFTETSSIGTDSTIELHLTVYPTPEVFIGNDTSIMVNEILTLESNSDFYRYLWNTNEISKRINVFGSIAGELKYWLQVEDSNGCINTDTINITIEEKKPNPIDVNYSDAIKVYPNPTADKIRIEIANTNISDVYIEMNAINGMNVYKKRIKSDYVSETINLNYLSEGIYILKISNQEFEKVIKILKE